MGCKNSNSLIIIHMRYDSCYLNLPQNGSLPRGGGLGWGQGYKFQKTYAFAWFGKRSNVSLDGASSYAAWRAQVLSRLAAEDVH